MKKKKNKCIISAFNKDDINILFKFIIERRINCMENFNNHEFNSKICGMFCSIKKKRKKSI